MLILGMAVVCLISLVGCNHAESGSNKKVGHESSDTEQTVQDSSIIKTVAAENPEEVELPGFFSGDWTNECELDIYYALDFKFLESQPRLNFHWGFKEDPFGYIIHNGDSYVSLDDIKKLNDKTYEISCKTETEEYRFRIAYVDEKVIKAELISQLPPSYKEDLKELTGTYALYNCSKIENQDELFLLQEKYSK